MPSRWSSSSLAAFPRLILSFPQPHIRLDSARRPRPRPRRRAVVVEVLYHRSFHSLSSLTVNCQPFRRKPVYWTAPHRHALILDAAPHHTAVAHSGNGKLRRLSSAHHVGPSVPPSIGGFYIPSFVPPIGQRTFREVRSIPSTFDHYQQLVTVARRLDRGLSDPRSSLPFWFSSHLHPSSFTAAHSTSVCSALRHITRISLHRAIIPSTSLISAESCLANTTKAPAASNYGRGLRTERKSRWKKQRNLSAWRMDAESVLPRRRAFSHAGQQSSEPVR